MYPRIRGFQFRAFGCPIGEQRRNLLGEAGLPEIDGREAAPGLETAGLLSGHAARFNTPSVDLGGFYELLSPGAFSRSLRERDVRALGFHDPSMLLGRMGNGSLKLWENSLGLGFELAAPRTDLGFDVLRLVRRADLVGMSFGFTVPEGGDTWGREGGRIVRRVHEARLLEISVVVWPAYPGTVIEEGDVASARARRLRSLSLRTHEAAVREDERQRAAGRQRRLRLLEATL